MKSGESLIEGSIKVALVDFVEGIVVELLDWSLTCELGFKSSHFCSICLYGIKFECGVLSFGLLIINQGHFSA